MEQKVSYLFHPVGSAKPTAAGAVSSTTAAAGSGSSDEGGLGDAGAASARRRLPRGAFPGGVPWPPVPHLRQPIAHLTCRESHGDGRRRHDSRCPRRQHRDVAGKAGKGERGSSRESTEPHHSSQPAMSGKNMRRAVCGADTALTLHSSACSCARWWPRLNPELRR